MSILSVDQISPIGSGTTITLNATEVKTGTEITVGTGASIFSPAGNTLTLGTNNVERIRIKNNGYVGIGTATPDSILNLFGTGSDAATRISIKDGGIANVVGRNGSLAFQADVDGTVNGSLINFAIDGSERLRIDSSGRVLMGTTTEGSSSADDLTIATTGTTGMTIRSGTSNNGNIEFSDGTSGQDEYRGIVQYAHSDNSMRFYTNAAEKVRITSDGSTQIASGVLQRRYESSNTAGYRYYSKADRFQIAHGGSGTNLTITGMNQGWASIRFGGYTEGQRVNFRADLGGYNAGNAGVRLYDSNEITNQATSYSSGSCNITVTKNNASYVVNVTQSNPQNATMASFYHFETGGYNSVSTLTIS